MTKFTQGKDTPESANGMSRRGVLKNLGLMLAGGALLAVERNNAVAVASTLAKPAPTGSDITSATSSVLMRSMFARHLGDTFRVSSPSSGPVAFKLDQVRDLGSAVTKAAVGGTNAHYESNFSVLFRGPANQLLAQGTYCVEHVALGAFDLFVVPMGENGRANYYEAVFNRLTA